MREFNSLISRLKLNNYQNEKIEMILNFFINQMTNQWFNDGNKRISLLVANKLLITIQASTTK